MTSLSLIFKANLKSISLLSASFCVTRFAALWLGLRYQSSEAIWLWQLLDLDLLHHHLGRSLLHLQAQPPILNTLVGLAEKLAGTGYGLVLLSLQLVLSLSANIAIFLALRLMRINSTVSLVLCLWILLDPTAILFEFDPLYTQLVVALHCFMALAIIRYVQTRSHASLYCLAGLALTLTLTRATYQWLWIIALFATLSWQLPENKRQTRIAGLACLFLGLIWPLKNELLFRHFTSSTWAPFSMQKHWRPDRPPVSGWIHDGRLVSFSPFTESEEGFKTALQSHWQAPKTGFPELDNVSKEVGGYANWNSLGMLRLNDAKAKDVLFLLRHDPREYAVGVLSGMEIYFYPTSLYFAGSREDIVQQYQKLRAPESFVRNVCCYVFGLPPEGPLDHARLASAPRLLMRLKSHIQRFCVGAILLYLTFFASLISLARRSIWRGAPDRRIAALVLSVTISYSFLIGNLIETGENMRFRFETQAIVFLVVAIFSQQIWDLRQPNRR